MPSSTRLALAVIAPVLCLAAGCSHGAREAPSDRQVERLPEKVETVEEYWPNGQLRLCKQARRSADGTLVNHGTYTQWYDNGRKEYEAIYVRGELDGVATAWHRNGQKWTEQHYDHGLRHGPRYNWDEEGRKRKEEHYFKDKPDGTWRTWNKNGSIKWQGRFDKGVPQS